MEEGGRSHPGAEEHNRKTKGEKCIELEGDEEMKDVAELISRVYMKLTVQLESRIRDLESATHCALFLLRDSVFVTDIQNAGSRQRSGGKPSMVLRGNAVGHRKDPGAKGGEWRTAPDLGKTEAMDTLRKTVEAQKPHELMTWVKACKRFPTFERSGHPLNSRMVFAVPAYGRSRKEMGASGVQACRSRRQ